MNDARGPVLCDGASPRDRRLTEGWVCWLRTMDWDWFCTPTFKHPVTPAQALGAIERWLRLLPDAYAAVGLQRGPMGDRLHVHAMIGGTGRHPLRETYLRGSWRRGNLHLDGFHPVKGAVEYLVRQADEIELIGQPRPYRLRRRLVVVPRGPVSRDDYLRAGETNPRLP